jgi:hypothetical protein
MDMKKLLIALAALTALGSAVAYAENCTTTCRWVGNQWVCNEHCTMY